MVDHLFEENYKKEWSLPPKSRHSPHFDENDEKFHDVPGKKEHDGSGDAWNNKLSAKWTSWTEEYPWDFPVPFCKVSRILKRAQWVLVLSCLIAGIAVPEIRKFIVDRTTAGICLVFILEFFAWAALSAILGKHDKFPLNYVSLAITGIFVAFELQFEWALQSRLEEEGRSMWFPTSVQSMGKRSRRRWSLWWGASSSTENALPKIHPLTITLFLTVLFLSTGWFVTRFSQIRIDKFGPVMLIGSYITTSTGTGILVSSLAITRIGQDLHLELCKIWASFALITIVVLAFYILQRKLCANDDHWMQRPHSDVEFFSLCLETCICLFQVMVVLHFISFVHPGFDASTAVNENMVKLTKALLPSNLTEKTGVQEAYNLLVFIGSIFTDYYSLVPNSMRMDN